MAKKTPKKGNASIAIVIGPPAMPIGKGSKKGGGKKGCGK